MEPLLCDEGDLHVAFSLLHDVAPEALVRLCLDHLAGLEFRGESRPSLTDLHGGQLESLGYLRSAESELREIEAALIEGVLVHLVPAEFLHLYPWVGGTPIGL